jgi:serine/threonine protein kinase
MEPRPIDPATWPALSVLLDEALALPDTERGPFVQSLAGERAAHRDTLQWLLAQAHGVETADFLATLPKLAGMPESGPLTELTAGESIGPYRLIGELGTGGMGAVWLAERDDGALRRKVALKLPRLVWAKGLAERMARERDILASLEHPHIARLYDAGADQHGRPYLALEYVEGQPIDVYAKDRKLTVREKLELLLQVCEAVAYAHSRLVVHRDLKPANILVTAQGQVRLLDFGIAKLMEGDSAKETQLTQLAGRALTLDYASPEQIKGEPIGTASDVYSLGVVAFEVLTGAKPYKLRRGSAAELEEAIATADPPNASDVSFDATAKKALRGDLDAILNKALKKTPGLRYATVEALAADIARHRSGQTVEARPDSLRYRAAKLAYRWRMAIAVGCATAVALSLAIGVGATALLIVVLATGLAAVLVLLQRARSQARRANLVQRFVLDMFRLSSTEHPDPLRAQNTTARELLGTAVKALRDQPPHDPRVAYDLTWSLLRVHSQLKLSEQAISLAHDVVRLSSSAFGRRSFEAAEAKLWLAQDLFAARRDFSQQRVLLEESRAGFESLRHRPMRELHLSRWCIAWSDLCLHEGQLAAATEAATLANGYAERNGSSEDRRAALARLGKLHMAAGHWTQALQFSERALDPRLGDEDHGNRLRRVATLAEVQMLEMEFDAARQVLHRALDFAHVHTGPWSMDAVQIRLRLVQASLMQGETGAAVDRLEALLEAPLAGDAAQPFVIAQARALLAEAWEADERQSKAVAEARGLVQDPSLHWRPRVSLWLLLGRCALKAAEPAAAQHAIEQAQTTLDRNQHSGNDPLCQQLLRLRAQRMGEQGQAAEAAALLAVDADDAKRPDRPCVLDTALRRAARAFWLAQAGALADAQRELALVRPAAERSRRVAQAAQRAASLLHRNLSAAPSRHAGRSTLS